MERILVLLNTAFEADTEETAGEAIARAAEPGRVSLALSDDPWRAVEGERVWQGEQWVLIAPASARFGKGWDRRLIRSLRRTGQAGGRAVLTGYLPRAYDAVNAVSPVAAEGFEADGSLRFHRGTPLRYAVRPERCAFLHPDFVFGPVGFFRETLRAWAEDGQPLWLQAMTLRYPLFTADDPALHLVDDHPLPPCPPPARDEALVRFETHFGVDFMNRTLDAKAQVGIYSGDLTAEARVPLSVRMQEGFRRADQWLTPPGRRARPMLVTCWITLPETLEARSPMMAGFRRLAAMRHVTLTCFADARSKRQLVLTHPNVLEFRQRHGLPTAEPVTQQNALNYTRLSKAFLLQQAKDVYPGHTHYVWINFDYLRYPVYEGAALDWETFCGGRISLALVGGEPDLSMIAVPTGRLEALCREIQRLCDTARAQGEPWPEETALWETLLQEHPGWFQTYEMPGWRELFSLAMTTKEEEWGNR